MKTYIKRCCHDDQDFISLVTLLDEDLTNRYGERQKRYNALNETNESFNMVVAYSNGKPVGCGCFKSIDEITVEIKRMFVLPEFRGTGAATLIINELEKWACEKGYKKAILDTGNQQAEAIRFYKKMNYNEMDNYGNYKGDEMIICMEKILLS